MEILATLIAVIAGAVGFLIASFWYRPIIRYKEIRSQIMADLVFYANAISPDGLNDDMKLRFEKRTEVNRIRAAELAAITVELPCWYKKFLENRNENPGLAHSELIGLSNTFEFEAASKRMEKIQQLLRVEPRVVI